LTWFEFRNPAKRNGRRSPSLEEIVKPYREAIVATSTPPAANRIDVHTWEDLTRASDTLGKPILRYTPNGGSAGRTFYVLDGATHYVFEFGSSPVREPLRELQPGEVTPAPNPPGPPVGRSPYGKSTLPTTFTSVELSPPVRSPADPRLDDRKLVRERTRELLARVSALPPSHPALNTALTTLGQAIIFLRTGRLDEAEHRLDDVERLIKP
jgi:hypothetical protein